MKFVDFMKGLQALQYKAAVYEEIISYLRTCVDDDVEVPVDIDTGRVPADVIEEVIQELRVRRDELVERLEVAETVEVAGVTYEDLAGR